MKRRGFLFGGAAALLLPLVPKPVFAIPGSNLFDVRDNWGGPGALLDGSADDTAAFQRAVNAAQAVIGNNYGPRAEVYCPPGYFFRTTSVIRCAAPAIRLNVRSTQRYDNPAGAAWIFNEYSPGGSSNYWDIYMSGIYAQPSAGGFPSQPNPAGSTGISMRNMTDSEINIRQLNGFSWAGLDLDGRGITYAGQVINKNHFELGQVANCGYGIHALSANAATSCVEGNTFDGIDIFQNCVNWCDGDASFKATTSNTLNFTTMDNETAIGLEMWCQWNIANIGFTGAPGTSVLFRPGSKHNTVNIANNYSSGVVVNDQSGGQNTVHLVP